MKNLSKMAALTLALSACGAEEEGIHSTVGEYNNPQICRPLSGEIALFDTDEVIDYCNAINESVGDVIEDDVIISCIYVDNECSENSVVGGDNFTCPDDAESKRYFLETNVFINSGTEPTLEFCVAGAYPQFECFDMMNSCN